MRPYHHPGVVVQVVVADRLGNARAEVSVGRDAFAPHPVEEARRFGGRAADLERERDLIVVGQAALAEAAVGAKLA